MVSAPLPSPEHLQDLVTSHGSPLLVGSRQALRIQYQALREALPGVNLHYALKPLPLPEVVTTLADAGCQFDICSNGEIDVLAANGIAGSRCIHTHPIKRDEDIRRCLDFGCDTLVFDNPDELTKLLPYRDRCRLLLRLSFRADDAVVDLSYKFGCAPDQALDLLRRARDLGFNLRGLSFHVGSQASNPAKHLEAIGFCRQLFNLAALDGIHLTTLDIGGGFPVTYRDPVLPIDAFCQPIMTELERHFAGTELIAEPGRFLAGPALTLVASVIGTATRGGRPWYYLDDGVYGSYSGQIYDHARYQLLAVKQLAGDAGPLTPSVVAGPTCDSIDIVDDGIPLPALTTGDLICSPTMGAYTLASATTFNHFPKTSVVWIDED